MAQQNSTSSIGFSGMLTILFIGLKLTGHINWAWLWVLAPLWINLAIALFFVVIGVVGASLFGDR